MWRLINIMNVQNKIRPRIESARTALGQVIPLETPFVVFIDPSSACNFKCTFCPTGDRELIRSTGRYQGVLHLDEYEKVLRDIADFPDKLKVLRLYKDGEPLLNRNLPRMIRMAREADVAGLIDTTTNGYLLNGKLGEELVRAGLGKINISIDGLDEKQFLHFTKSKVDMPTFLQNLRDFYSVSGDCEVVIKTTSEIIGEDRKQEFFDLFGDHCDRIFVENTSPCWPDFDVEQRMGIEITTGLYGNEIVDTDVCPYLFYSISVNSDLSVSACFVDWSRGMNVGSLRERSLKDVWLGPEMQAHRLSHLQGKRYGHAICGNCSQVTHCKADNIDADAAKLLAKYEALDTDAFSRQVLEAYAKHD